MFGFFGGLFETGCKSQKFFQVGSPPFSLQCTTFLNLLVPMIVVTMGVLWHCPSSAPTRGAACSNSGPQPGAKTFGGLEGGG